MKRIISTLYLIQLCFNIQAQAIGNKVSLIGTDGKSYNGVIQEIRGDQYKVKYEGYDFEAWLGSNQFTILNEISSLIKQTALKTDHWTIGDKVEAYDLYTNKWENATISAIYSDRTPPAWRVYLDETAGHSITDFPVTKDKIRSRDASASVSFSVNMRVDAYYADGIPKGRATIIEVKPKGRYKIKYDGCKDYLDEEVDWSQLKPASIIASTDISITSTFGKWAMFAYSYPNTTVKGNDLYREYGTGAKAPPLLIQADGTFIWYDVFHQPPVKGKWSVHAKIEGITTGTDWISGIVIFDSKGYQWKVYRDATDHIIARVFCSGEELGGTRIK